MTNDEINLFLHTPGAKAERFVISKQSIQRAMASGDTVAEAVAESRCIKPELGCGKPIEVDRKTQKYWPSDAYRREWQITGLCAPCQDRVDAAMAAMTEE